MELKEFIGVFRKNIKLFFGLFFLIVFLGLIFFLFQRESKVANLMINVSRKGVQQTQDYRYDDFYRLQADERFADTVVRWISSPNILNEIADEAEINKGKKIKARRLSSQMIEVVFTVENQAEAERISQAITKTLEAQVAKLDEFQKEENWFVLVANEAEVLDGKVRPEIIFWASFALGLFFAIFGVMMKNYLE